MAKAKLAVVKEEAPSLYDVNDSAPEFFDLQIDPTPKEAAEWARRAYAFVTTMRSLERAVMLVADDDSGKMYLASVPERPNV